MRMLKWMVQKVLLEVQPLKLLIHLPVITAIVPIYHLIGKQAAQINFSNLFYIFIHLIILFSRFLEHFQTNSAMHKEMLAVLAAIAEVIKQNGGKETSTEYYAALVSIYIRQKSS